VHLNVLPLSRQKQLSLRTRRRRRDFLGTRNATDVEHATGILACWKFRIQGGVRETLLFLSCDLLDCERHRREDAEYDRCHGGHGYKMMMKTESLMNETAVDSSDLMTILWVSLQQSRKQRRSEQVVGGYFSVSQKISTLTLLSFTAKGSISLTDVGNKFRNPLRSLVDCKFSRLLIVVVYSFMIRACRLV
jgi:hypothetical protein